MPEQNYFKFGFQGGYNPEGGPFFPTEGYIKDGKNTIHTNKGLISNRPGIELLNEIFVKTIDDQSDATYTFVPSVHYGEFKKENGYIIQGIFLRTGSIIRIYLNDTDPTPLYSTTLSNIDIRSPDQTFFLSDVSQEAIYYRTFWSTEGNTVIVSNPKAPLMKLIWTGTNFTSYRIEAEEYNEQILKLPRAATLGKAIPGWFSREIPLKTGTTSYTVLDFIVDAVPDYGVTIFKIAADGTITKVDPANYTYAEALDTSINLVTCTLTYTTATTGDSLRVYFGQTPITDYDAETALERIVVSDRNKDYATGDNSYNPKQIIFFGGRVWLFGLDGPLDGTLDSTYSAYGTKYKKTWISEIFPDSLSKQEITTLKCRPNRGPLDIDDNTIVATDGGVIELDDAGRIVDGAGYESALYLVATNGVWYISGRDDYISLGGLIIKPIISHTFSSKEPMVATEYGIFAFGDSEIFWINPRNKEAPVTPIAENRIESVYKSLSLDTKSTSFVRYDKQNKRVYYWYNDDSTYQGKSKYKECIGALKYLCYDIPTQSWLTPGDYSAGDWYISDSITVPTNNYFSGSDTRASKYSKVNLVVLSKKNNNFTDLTFGILEGKPYCADYYGTSYKAAFSSYVESFNTFGQEFGIGNKKQVARASFFMERQEEGDADADGYYTYPGALYMYRRWNFSDHENAGPLYDYQLNSGQTAWAEQGQQIYFPLGYGKTVLGGGAIPYEVITFDTKIRGRGNVIRLKFGNKFGDTELTGTTQEQEKGWGLYGFELKMKGY